MSSEEKKKYLLRYRNCERSITRVEAELAHWQSRAEWVTSVYRHEPTGSGDGDRMQTAICQLAELRGLLYDRLTDAAQTRREIERAIGSVEEQALRLLLEYRYIGGLTYEQIADEMCYSGRQINNLHNKAIDTIVIG